MNQKPNIFSRIITGFLGKSLDSPDPKSVDLSTPEASQNFYRNIGAGWPLILEAMDFVIKESMLDMVTGDPKEVIPRAEDTLLFYWAREGWVPAFEEEGDEAEEEEEDEEEGGEEDGQDEIPVWEVMLGEYVRQDPIEHKLALINAIALHGIWKKYPQYFPDGYVPTAEDAMMGMSK